MPERAVITPELARQFLARSSRIRSARGEADVDQARVTRYASEMRNGRWEAERSIIYLLANGSAYRLVLEDGTPADPATLTAAVPNWKPGDTIPLGAGRILRVVDVRENVLVVARA